MSLYTVFERNDAFWHFTPHGILVSSVSYLSYLRMLSGLSPRITWVNPGMELSRSYGFPAVKAHGSLGKSVLLFAILIRILSLISHVIVHSNKF